MSVNTGSVTYVSGLVANVGVPVGIGSQAQSVQLLFQFPVSAGLLISISASDSDTIGDTFEVSISVSPTLLRGSIGIGDTFFGCIGIDYRRYF